MNSDAQGVVDKYMRRLKRQLAGLPRARRNEILDEIREHADEAIARSKPSSEEEAQSILDQLGDPSEIADEARQRFDILPAKFGAREIAALVLLPFGAILYGAGWFLGVVLIWTSEAWTTREKLVATLAPPGGLVSWLFIPQYFPTSPFVVVVGVAGLILGLVVPIWLCVRARKRVRLTPRSGAGERTRNAAIESVARGSSR